MRTPLLRHELRAYHAAQRVRAFKFAIFTGAWLLAGFGIGALAAQNLTAAIAVFTAGMLLGYFLHAITRPMP